LYVRVIQDLRGLSEQCLARFFFDPIAIFFC
jgi:hypothetical protein